VPYGDEQAHHDIDQELRAECGRIMVEEAI
jgi:hypothetical protein